MDYEFQAFLLGFLQDVAVFSGVTVAHASLKRLGEALAPGWRQIAVGLLFGLATVIAIGLSLLARPHGVPSEAYAAVALAAPFGGILAAVIAAAPAVACSVWLLGPAAGVAVVEICLAALLAIAFTEVLRRQRRAFAAPQLVLLALLMLLPAVAVLMPPPVGFRSLSSADVLVNGIGLPVATLVFGALLLRWCAIERRAVETERQLKAVVNNLPGVALRLSVSPTGEITFPFVSAEAAELFSVPRADAEADAALILRCIHPDDLAQVKRSLFEAGKSFGIWSHEFRILGRNGKMRWLLGRALPHRFPMGGIVWDGLALDISRRKEREEALRRSEDLYRLLADNTTEVISRIGSDERRLYASPSARHILGYEPSELVGQSFFAIGHPDDVERLKAALSRLRPDGAPTAFIYRVRRKDGSYLWVRDMRRLAGQNGLQWTRESISVLRPFERRRPEEELAPSRKPEEPRLGNIPFVKLLEAAHAGVIVTDPHQPDNPVVFVNAEASAITGYDPAELMGRNGRLLQGPETDQTTIAEIRHAVAEERAISTTLLNYRKDGRPFWSKLEISPVRGADGKLEAFVNVFFDVSEQKRLEAELRLARDAAEQANQAKTEFLANISHELRTPLNGVIGFTNLLLNENLPAEQRRYATFARDAGSSLLAIINNVLDLSKIEAGKLELSESDFSVVELAVSCNTVVWHAAREKGLDLNFVLKPDVVNVVRGDPDRIRQVLLNLLSNAIKFTTAGSVVLSISKVEDTPEGTILKFSVTDTGIGIPEEKQRLLFQKFSQLDVGVGRQLGGTGLGLAICKSLVEHMGGTIGVKSTPGVGSSFWFTVPLKAASAAAYAQSRRLEQPHRKARVLLAEDTPMNQELTVTLLRRAGHEVEVVSDGAAALAAVQQRPFDIILMDVQMPVLDGYEATRAIRALAGDAGKIPIVAMTARALMSDVEKCLAAGMDDHIAKPIDAAALLAVIEHWTRGETPRPQPAAAEPAGPPPVHEVAALVSLEEHLGRERVAEMITEAGEQIPQRLHEMHQHLDDRERLARDAHELVSLAGNLGFMEMVTLARELMERCGEGGERIPEALDALTAAADRALAVIERLEPWEEERA
jgi:PAS domain S-box-containing protein